jgi:bifunctional non-homologous end joining protein LigD
VRDVRANLPRSSVVEDHEAMVKIEVSSPRKLLFPAVGITKRDLVDYYARVAQYMLPHIRDRPLSMQRFPEGIDRQGFFQKNVPTYFPHWIPRVTVPKQGGTVTHAMARDADTLVYLAGQACITPHTWLSRAPALEYPDRMVFDLDPPDGQFPRVREAARLIGEVLEELGLPAYAMTTGSRGVHVSVPLQPRARFEAVRDFTRDLAQLLAARHPSRLTVEQRKAKRAGRILIDVMRNAYAQTAVPPYAVRPRARAPVATPLRWEELSDSRLRPDKFTTRNLFRRLAASGDPWSQISRHRRDLEAPRRRLDQLLVAHDEGGSTRLTPRRAQRKSSTAA